LGEFVQDYGELWEEDVETIAEENKIGIVLER
jgi:hypothetical protein